jgi:two-component system OmpR family response regulator
VLPLSNAEFRLLGTFLNHPRQLLSREQLMDEARGRHMEAFDRSIDLLVSRLRHKLDQGGGPTGFIKTVRGLGYLFQVRTIRKLQGQELR